MAGARAWAELQSQPTALATAATMPWPPVGLLNKTRRLPGQTSMAWGGESSGHQETGSSPSAAHSDRTSQREKTITSLQTNRWHDKPDRNQVDNLAWSNQGQIRPKSNQSCPTSRQRWPKSRLMLDGTESSLIRPNLLHRIRPERGPSWGRSRRELARVRAKCSCIPRMCIGHVPHLK